MACGKGLTVSDGSVSSGMGICVTSRMVSMVKSGGGRGWGSWSAEQCGLEIIGTSPGMLT